MKYKSVIVTRRDSPEVLKIIENDLLAPSAGEAKIAFGSYGIWISTLQI